MGGGPPQNRDLKELVRQLAKNGPVKAMHTPKRIRLLFDGAFIADTAAAASALYVWEHEYYPQFYLPMEAFVAPKGFDVNLTHGEAITDEKGKVVGGGLEIAVRRKGTNDEYKVLNEMVIFAADLEGRARCLRNIVKVNFSSVDQWFEEDTPIYVHPKDPFKRVDCVQVNRPFRITMPLRYGSSETDDHIVLAESLTSVHLYESLLPPRYYLPYTSLQTIYLRNSDSITECPYKGVAQYHHVVVNGKEHRDLVWWYRAPTADCIAVTGLRCFYTEKVDVWMKDSADGSGSWKMLERPKSG